MQIDSPAIDGSRSKKLASDDLLSLADMHDGHTSANSRPDSDVVGFNRPRHDQQLVTLLISNEQHGHSNSNDNDGQDVFHVVSGSRSIG